MKKQIVSWLLVLALVLSMVPATAMAAETAPVVYLSVSSDGQYVTAGGTAMAYVPVSLSALEAIDLDTYGLGDYKYDADGDGSYEVTALHLFIYSHESLYGGDWSSVSISGAAGSLFFEGGLWGFSMNMTYYHNGTYPIDEAMTDVNGYSTGATADHIVLEDGDFVDLAGYSDYSFWTDENAGFRYFYDTEGNVTHSYSALLGDTLTVTMGRAMQDWSTGTPQPGMVTDEGLTVSYSQTFPDANAKTAVTDAEGKATLTLDKTGTWYVWANGDAVSAPAYATVNVGWKNNTGVTAYWPNFRNSNANMAITDVATPTSAETTVEKWVGSFGSGWSNSPSGLIIVDNALVFMNISKLKKVDLQTGAELASANMSASSGYVIISPTYGDGLIFCPLSGGKIEAFNAKTLESVWLFSDTLGGQNNTPITYSDGYLYTGFWNGETADANFVCVDASDGSLVWSKTVTGGFYWAGSVVVGDAVIVGTDNGADDHTSNAHLYALDKKSGNVISDLDSVPGDQRSSIAYSAEHGRVYFTTKGGYLCSAAVDAETGTLSDLKTNLLAAQATSTPVVYGDKVYVSAGTGIVPNSNGDGNFFVADAESLETLYAVPLKAYPQGSVMISTAYLETEGKLYCYTTYNGTPGGMTLIKVDPTKDTADGAELIEIYDAAGHEQYCLISPICGPDGTIYYRNDSGYIFALAENSAYLTGLTADVGRLNSDFATSDMSYELVVPAGTASVSFTATACEGGSVTVNGADIATPVVLTEGAATAQIKVTKGDHSRTYTVSIREISSDTSLKVVTSGSNNISSSTSVVEATGNVFVINSVTKNQTDRVWFTAGDANGTAVGTFVEGVSKSISSATSTNVYDDVAYRNRIYFGSFSGTSLYRVDVTAEDGATAVYYILVSSTDGSGYSYASDVSLNKAEATVDVTEALTLSGQISYLGTAAAAETEILWTSSDESIATVSSTGVVTPMTTGEVVITATVNGKLSPAATCTVTVTSAAAIVEALIDEIGEVTLESTDAIEAAREAYNALTEEQKALVSNYDTLVAAEEELERVKDENTAIPIDVSVTISNAGDVVVSLQTVTVTDVNNNGIFDVDDALYAIHEEAYTGGAAAGYATTETQWGLSLAKLWGVEGGNYGYWLNNASCWSLEDELKNNDTLVAFVYVDTVYWTDSYSKFDKFSYTAGTGTGLNVTLQNAGYDADYNTVFSGKAGATITAYDADGNALSGEDFTFTDNGSGSYTVTFAQEGTYILIATASDILMVPAVSTVTVENSEDLAAAQAVSRLIDAIGTVTLESEEAIKAARTAYNALTDAQKELVENYDVLAAAEAALDELKKDSSLPDTGDDTNIRLFVSLLVMSMMGLTALILIPRKKVV